MSGELFKLFYCIIHGLFPFSLKTEIEIILFIVSIIVRTFYISIGCIPERASLSRPEQV